MGCKYRVVKTLFLYPISGILQKVVKYYMKKNNEIKELSEILATALAERPDLNKRLSTMLGAPPRRGDPGAAKKQLTHKERKDEIRMMFRNQFLKDQLKKAI